MPTPSTKLQIENVSHNQPQTLYRPLKLIRSDSRSASTLITDRMEILLASASSSDPKHLCLTCHLLLVLGETPFKMTKACTTHVSVLLRVPDCVSTKQ